MVASAETAERKPQLRNGEHPFLAKLKARNLYLQDNLSHQAISEATGIPVRTLQQLANTEGWVAIKRRNRARLLEKQDARISAMAEEVIDAIASSSEQHAIRALQKVGESLERNDRDAAKDFQAYTAGVRNLATTAKALRETGVSVATPTNLQANFFFAPAYAPIEAKQATEVEAKRVQ